MRRHLIIGAALLALLSPAKAADSTVTALTAASAFGGTELMYIVQAAADRKGTPAQMATYVYGLASGDCTISGVGAVVCTKTNGVAFGTAATANTGISGATIPLLNAANTWSAVQSFNANDLLLAGVTGSTQCLHASTTGVVTGTGSDCGAGGGASGIVPYTATKFYIPWGVGVTSNTGSVAANTVRCSMAYFKGLATLDTLGVFITTAAAGGNTQLAIYAVTAGLPSGTALATTASISTTSTGHVNGAVNSSVPIQLGSSTNSLTPLAFCINNDTTAGSTVNFTMMTSNVTNMGGDFGADTALHLMGSGSTFTSLTVAQTFATWPNLTGAGWTYNAFQTILPVFHISSVP